MFRLMEGNPDGYPTVDAKMLEVDAKFAGRGRVIHRFTRLLMNGQ